MRDRSAHINIASMRDRMALYSSQRVHWPRTMEADLKRIEDEKKKLEQDRRDVFLKYFRVHPSGLGCLSKLDNPTDLTNSGRIRTLGPSGNHT